MKCFQTKSWLLWGEQLLERRSSQNLFLIHPPLHCIKIWHTQKRGFILTYRCLEWIFHRSERVLAICLFERRISIFFVCLLSYKYSWSWNVILKQWSLKKPCGCPGKLPKDFHTGILPISSPTGQFPRQFFTFSKWNYTKRICINEIGCESTTIVSKKGRNEFNVFQGQYRTFWWWGWFF